MVASLAEDSKGAEEEVVWGELIEGQRTVLGGELLGVVEVDWRGEG